MSVCGVVGRSGGSWDSTRRRRCGPMRLVVAGRAIHCSFRRRRRRRRRCSSLPRQQTGPRTADDTSLAIADDLLHCDWLGRIKGRR